MRKEDKICIDCGTKGVKERHRCEKCAKEYNRKRARERYAEYGRPYFVRPCILCEKDMNASRKTQLYHRECYKKFLAENAGPGNNTTGHIKAREFARKLGLIMNQMWCVHHIDENHKNNSLSNLAHMSKKAHAQLHAYLRHHRSLWLKNQSKHDENCWKTLRDHLTTAWLEMTSAKVTKLSDIGQSAAEPLNEDDSQEEGSEAMHVDPKEE